MKVYFAKFREFGLIIVSIPCSCVISFIFRGNKAKNAADFGCAGLIIYSDPMEVACEGTDPEHVSTGLCNQYRIVFEEMLC